MKKVVQMGGLVALLGAGALLGVGLLTPQPAGACSCIDPSAELELVEVRLIDSPEVTDEDQEALVDAQTDAWPEVARFFSDTKEFEGESTWFSLGSD